MLHVMLKCLLALVDTGDLHSRELQVFQVGLPFVEGRIREWSETNVYTYVRDSLLPKLNIHRFVDFTLRVLYKPVFVEEVWELRPLLHLSYRSTLFEFG